MKLKNSLFNRALLLTTMLFTPSIAAAQDTPTTPPEPAAQSDDATADPMVDMADMQTTTEEIVVRGRNIPQPMRQTSEVVTVLSTADLQRTGDDNAAAALTRLAGLSVVGNRFVYVRGLGDRYSSALLNGSPLPSPEPLRRQVPLDLFPSNILSGANVQKTFSPNYPGEFGGGVIDLRTLRIPNRPFLTLKTATGWNTEASLRNGFFYQGSETDWSGFDDGLRDLPGPLAAAIGRGRAINRDNFTDAELERIGESLVNSPLNVVQRGELDGDLEIEATGGTSLDFGKYNLGLVGVVGYDSTQRTRRATRTEVVGGSLETDFDTDTTTWDIVLNAFGSGTLGWGENELTLSGLLVRSSTQYAQVEEGVDFNQPGVTAANPVPNERREATAWYERQIANLQLAGEHEFGDLQLKWRTAAAQSTRDAPYERNIRYDLINGVAVFGGGGGLGNRIRFSELTDEVLSAGLDANYTLAISDQRDIELSAGFSYSNTTRVYEQFQFAWTGPFGPTGQDTLTARVDFLLSPDNISPLRFVLQEQTGLDDSYKGRLTNNAFYVAADMELLPLVRASLGVRYEDASQTVRTTNRFGLAPTARPVALDNSYVLPAATLTWNFAEDLQLRVGYSQTIARPQFRELAFTPFIDPDNDRVSQGNPFLQDSEFQNYDARLEYYFGRDRYVTFGGFYKQIENPIEEVVFRRDRFQTNYINAPEATLYGVEFDVRTRFEMPFEMPFLQTAEWLAQLNYTYTYSEVNAPAGSTVINPLNSFRPAPSSEFQLDGSQLQGTPENIINVQFGYETENQQLTLVAGWVDERILRRGLGATRPVLERPGTNVDLVFRQDFSFAGANLTLGLTGRNLLETEYKEFQINPAVAGATVQVARETDVNTYDRGRTFGISLTARY